MMWSSAEHRPRPIDRIGRGVCLERRLLAVVEIDHLPRVLETEQKATVIIDGHEVITLSSNNYLGLTVHPRLREAAIKAIEQYGVGSGSVRTKDADLSCMPCS